MMIALPPAGDADKTNLGSTTTSVRANCCQNTDDIVEPHIAFGEFVEVRHRITEAQLFGGA
jgi:hypothetical protein